MLKLFYEWFGLENVEHEAQVSQVIHASGLPVPAVGEIVCQDGRYGLVYQRVYGESMFKLFQHKPWNFFIYSRRMAELQNEIRNSLIPAPLPSQRQQLERNILQAEALPSRLRLKVLAELDSLPDGDRLCHGDFWPGNILISPQGEMIIDWFRATRGNPLADLARTTNLVICFSRTSQVRRPFLSFSSTETNTNKSSMKNSLFQVFCQICYPVYLNSYFKLWPYDREQYKRWLPVVAAARLADNIPELQETLITQVEKNF